MSIIAVQDLTKDYGNNKGVFDISIYVDGEEYRPKWCWKINYY